MEEDIFKGESYAKIKSIRNYFLALRTKSFPTESALRLIDLVLKLVMTIQQRYSLYSIGQVRQIRAFLLPFLEMLCGLISQAQMTNVPWSIIPALSKLLREIQSENEFILCPIWEANYKLLHLDIVAHIREKIAMVPGLLFDSNPQFSKNVNRFFKNHRNGIYLILYPKIERLSALHFSLLGHEIGHIFASSFIKNNYGDFLRTTNLEPAIEKVAREEAKTKLPLFKDVYVATKKYEYFPVFQLIFAELTSDTYGCCIFGYTSLIATYFFSNAFVLDDVTGWKKGYLSWRFRLRNLAESLTYVDRKFATPAPIGPYVELINNAIGADVQDGKADPYIAVFILAFQQYRDTILESIIGKLGKRLFITNIKPEMIDKVLQRLENRIPPNAYLDADLNEHPIDFRTILYGTWTYLSRNISSDFKEYDQLAKLINLLSMKGIEFSVEQEQYLDFIQRRNSR